jgi:hypothetical protein
VREFKEANTFSEGLAPVLVGEKWGYVDKAGILRVSPQFKEPGGFSEGSASRNHCYER